MDRQAVLGKLLDAAAAAAKVVMRVYAEADHGVEFKQPNDPVTRADKEANALLLERLAADFPGVPIVAEESDPATYAGFGAAPYVLFVDPVDGTREFVARSGDFSVMIGFAERRIATVGVVDCPALGEVYGGIVGEGAFRISRAEPAVRTPIHVSATKELASCRCAISRNHTNPTTLAKIDALGARELLKMGGAGLKGVRVASGEVDVFARPTRGPAKLWDACAPDAIVRAAGGLFTDAVGRAFDYAGDVAFGRGVLAANPVLHAAALSRFAENDRSAS
jgi:3'(2'), 5'-bisphosphate nucleotidase